MSAVAALRGGLGSAVCHWAGAVPVHRRTSLAPLLPLLARPQRSRDRPLHPVDRVIEWVHRPRSLLHGLRRSSPLHRAYRVNSPANATRHKQPGQKSHPPALPRKRTPSAAAPCYADASIGQEVDVAPREAQSQSQPYSHSRCERATCCGYRLVATGSDAHDDDSHGNGVPPPGKRCAA